MNPYHYYLNLPFEIQKPNIFIEQHTVVKHEILPFDLPEAQVMLEFLKQLNLDCHNLEYFYTPPNSGKISIHSDNFLDEMTKINVTWGPESGVVRWWNCPSYKTLKLESGTTDFGESDSYHEVYVAEEDESTLVHEASTNKISMLNVGKFHSTYNPGTEGRYTLCFALRQTGATTKLQWPQAEIVFKDYLE